eukprot:1783548-Rhodomonas_salina.1
MSISLRRSYAVSGTDLGYCATRGAKGYSTEGIPLYSPRRVLRAGGGTERACAMRMAVLGSRIVVLGQHLARYWGSVWRYWGS